MRLVVRKRQLTEQSTSNQECFARGVAFRKAIADADHYLGEAEDAVLNIRSVFDEGAGEYVTRDGIEHADELIVSTIAAMLEAQRVIGETTCLAPEVKQPFIEELRIAIDAIKGSEGTDLQSPFKDVDTEQAFHRLARIELIGELK